MNDTKSVKIYKKAINECREDILNGMQVKKEKVEYEIGKNMSAASNKGKRDTQEDSVLILEHPENSQLKLIAVADGVGGYENGEQASEYLLRKLIIYFEALPKRQHNNLDFIKRTLEGRIKDINDRILEYNIGKTTLSMAIITKKETLLLNIGDSRIYTYKDENLKQETKDDSFVEMLYDCGIIKKRELGRFHKRANEITNCLGIQNIIIKSEVIKTNYELILGATDGVCDYLSKDEIKKVIETKKGNLAKELVEKAIVNISINKDNVSRDYEDIIIGGHDNASAAIVRIR